MKDTQLHINAERGDIEIVSLLLANKTDVNRKGSQGNTSLHVSVIHGFIEIVKSLLESKADPNTKNNIGETPLHLSAQYGHAKISLALLGKGANVNVQNVAGETPLHLSARFGHADVVSALLDKGADVNVKNNDDDSPLHVSVAYRRTEIVSRLLDNKADVNVKRRSGDTALHVGVRYGEAKIVSLLLDNKAEVNICNELGYTPLHVSAESGDFDIMSMLLEKDADLHAKCHRGFTPLEITVRRKHKRMTQQLMQHDSGADKSKHMGANSINKKKRVTFMNGGTVRPDRADNKATLKITTMEMPPEISTTSEEQTKREISSGFKIRHNSSDPRLGRRNSSRNPKHGDRSYSHDPRIGNTNISVGGIALSTNTIMKQEITLNKPFTSSFITSRTPSARVTPREDTTNATSYNLHSSTDTKATNVPASTNDDRRKHASVASVSMENVHTLQSTSTDPTSAVEDDHMLGAVSAGPNSGEISALDNDHRLKTPSPAKYKEDTVSETQKQFNKTSEIFFEVPKTVQNGNTFVNVIFNKTVKSITMEQPFGVTIRSVKYISVGGSIKVGSGLSDTSSDTNGTVDGNDDTESSNENIDVAVPDTGDRQEI